MPQAVSLPRCGEPSKGPRRRIELLPSPIEIVDPPSREAKIGRWSIFGSIVLMLELGGRRALLTADATSDVLLHALAQAGYTDEQGNMNLDVLVLPHAGSARNLSREFFRRVKARRYVVLCRTARTGIPMSRRSRRCSTRGAMMRTVSPSTSRTRPRSTVPLIRSTSCARDSIARAPQACGSRRSHLGLARLESASTYWRERISPTRASGTASAGPSLD